jgi:hypothetical protein
MPICICPCQECLCNRFQECLASFLRRLFPRVHPYKQGRGLRLTTLRNRLPQTHSLYICIEKHNDCCVWLWRGQHDVCLWGVPVVTPAKHITNSRYENPLISSV